MRLGNVAPGTPEGTSPSDAPKMKKGRAADFAETITKVALVVLASVAVATLAIVLAPPLVVISPVVFLVGTPIVFYNTKWGRQQCQYVWTRVHGNPWFQTRHVSNQGRTVVAVRNTPSQRVGRGWSDSLRNLTRSSDASRPAIGTRSAAVRGQQPSLWESTLRSFQTQSTRPSVGERAGGACRQSVDSSRLTRSMGGARPTVGARVR